jgi:sec-independent protein translocase protein TatA
VGTFGIWHILILATVALVLFGGRGKVSDLMGDFGRGVSSFKKGLNEHKDDPKVINAETAEKTKDTVER